MMIIIHHQISTQKGVHHSALFEPKQITIIITITTTSKIIQHWRTIPFDFC